MRQAEQTDAPELAQLLRATGLDDNPDPARIARVVLESNHTTLVETAADGSLIGFVDAFSTVALDGRLRWEVDLLGVHPAHRGKKIAQRLIRAAVDAGVRARAYPARALVKIDNTASLKAFQASGFMLDPTIYDLYISPDDEDGELTSLADTYLISVATLTYDGIWIEGEFSLPALRCGAAERSRAGLDIAGAVVPAGTLAAEQAGYKRVGQYRWLRL